MLILLCGGNRSQRLERGGQGGGDVTIGRSRDGTGERKDRLREGPRKGKKGIPELGHGGKGSDQGSRVNTACDAKTRSAPSRGFVRDCLLKWKIKDGEMTGRLSGELSSAMEGRSSETWRDWKAKRRREAMFPKKLRRLRRSSGARDSQRKKEGRKRTGKQI